MNTGAYCRAVESHLCRKNDGHLIRIVGPAFELVCGWEEAGIPISVVERAIDRRYARYYASGPKRRPVRIEYCEPDVLDTFDEWRRSAERWRIAHTGRCRVVVEAPFARGASR